MVYNNSEYYRFFFLHHALNMRKSNLDMISMKGYLDYLPSKSIMSFRCDIKLSNKCFVLVAIKRLLD